MSYFMFDAVERLADSVFQQPNRQHVTLLLAQGQSERAVQDALALPGVLAAEGAYAMPVRALNGHRNRLTALQSHFPGAELARLVDDAGRIVTPPAEGVILPEMLARALGVDVGQILRLEMLAAPPHGAQPACGRDHRSRHGTGSAYLCQSAACGDGQRATGEHDPSGRAVGPDGRSQRRDQRDTGDCRADGLG